MKRLTIRGDLFQKPPKKGPPRPDLRKVKNLDDDPDLDMSDPDLDRDIKSSLGDTESQAENC